MRLDPTIILLTTVMIIVRTIILLTSVMIMVRSKSYTTSQFKFHIQVVKFEGRPLISSHIVHVCNQLVANFEPCITVDHCDNHNHGHKTPVA